MKKMLSVVILILLLAGCSQKQEQAAPPVAAAPSPAPAVEQPVETAAPVVEEKVEEEKESNTFDARKLKAGDMVAGLKAVKVEVHNAADEDYDAYVTFEGEVTVIGTFKHNIDDEFLDHEISFVVDDESAAMLPKLAHDQRYVWFMFMNHDEAEEALGAAGAEGAATVTIKNYTINYAHTEIWNTADLVRAEENR